MSLSQSIGIINTFTTASTVQKICDGLEITILDFFTSPLFENLEQEIK